MQKILLDCIYIITYIMKFNIKGSFSIIAVSCVAFVLSSCVSYKKVPYFQNADQVNLSASRGIHDARIMPKDVLSISVTTPDKEVSSQFNQLVYNTLSSSSRAVATAGGSMMPYTVGADGKDILWHNTSIVNTTRSRKAYLFCILKVWNFLI